MPDKTITNQAAEDRCNQQVSPKADAKICDEPQGFYKNLAKMGN